MKLLFGTLASALFCMPAFAQWRYDWNIDSMTGKRNEYATVESVNSLHLDFPYSGHNPGTLTIRKSPWSGTNVVLRIDKGQFICSPAEGCRVLVRFDDAQPVYFNAVGPTDHSSTRLFLEPEERFIAAAKKAKVIRIQATVYQAGSLVLEFNASDLEWPMQLTKQASK